VCPIGTGGLCPPRNSATSTPIGTLPDAGNLRSRRSWRQRRPENILHVKGSDLGSATAWRTAQRGHIMLEDGLMAPGEVVAA